MTFTWNSSNELSHYHKYKIHFAEAITVFDDPYAIESIDTRHGELRFTRIGVSDSGNLLRVTYIEESFETIRIISVRKASPANRKAYLTGLV